MLKSPEAIRAAVLAAVGGNEQVLRDVLDGKRSVVNTCGSGMTACIVWLGLQLTGVRSAVYDEVCISSIYVCGWNAESRASLVVDRLRHAQRQQDCIWRCSCVMCMQQCIG